jgi:glycosyltransferase involved in cell wall biosynthesis
MSRPLTITAAIIAQNEQGNLAGLLPRLDWVDEIVLVDGGSHDGTASLARAHGCRVLERRFDTFARQRNYALQHSQSDWVLSIDADECPTPQLAAEIRRRIGDDRYAAYRVPIRSTIFGYRVRYSGTQDDRPVRLVRRGAARWTGDVHEVLRVAGRTSQLENWLEHRTMPDLASFLAKVDRYTRLEAVARVAAGRRPRPGTRWIAPLREVFRRLAWKHGILDGPAGWAFCILSGYSEWVLAQRHRQLWATSQGLIESRVEPAPGAAIPIGLNRRRDSASPSAFCQRRLEEATT